MAAHQLTAEVSLLLLRLTNKLLTYSTKKEASSHRKRLMERKEKLSTTKTLHWLLLQLKTSTS